MSANSPANGIGPVPENVQLPAGPIWLQILLSWITMIARVVNLTQRGKINAVTTITLTASATTTTLTDDRIGPSSYVGLSPLTDTARSLDGLPYISSRGSGSAVITHGSSTATDLSYVVAILG